MLIDYVERGFKVFPVHSIVDGACTCKLGAKCESPGKHPANRNGCKGAAASVDGFPEGANIGIATGDGFFVLDIDPRHHGDETLAQLEREHGPLPVTPEVVTGGGGRHLYFRGALPSSAGRIGPGVDVRGEGGYVVAPPSLHASGRRYEWDLSAPIDDVPIAEAPAWLLACASPSPLARPIAYVAAMPPSVAGQNGHGAAFAVANKLVNGFGLDASTALGILREHFNPRCEPPWSERELEHKIASAVETGRGEPVASRRGEPVAPRATPLPPRPAPGVDVGDHDELARIFVEEIGEAMIFDEGSFWRYDPIGIWRELDDAELNNAIAGRFRRVFKSNGKPVGLNASTFLGVRGRVRDLLPRVYRFADAARGMAFANGFWTLEHGLRPHAPEHMARHAYGFPLDLRASGPKLAAFFAALFGDLSEDEALAREELLSDFLGTAFVGKATDYQRALVLVGDGSNGKSALLKLISGAFPPGAVSWLTPHAMLDRFGAVDLVGKRLNIGTEVASATLGRTDRLKAILAGDRLRVEHKGAKAFTFTPTAGHIFACNALPTIADASDGMWRRMLVLPMTRVFGPGEGSPDPEVPILREELPALVAWLIGGATRVFRRGGYAIPTAVASATREWREASDPVRDWAEGYVGPWHRTARELLVPFREFERQHGIRAEVHSSVEFGRRLARIDFMRSRKTGNIVWWSSLPNSVASYRNN